MGKRRRAIKRMRAREGVQPKTSEAPTPAAKPVPKKSTWRRSKKKTSE